jgi:hypothetical protein
VTPADGDVGHGGELGGVGAGRLRRRDVEVVVGVRAIDLVELGLGPLRQVGGLGDAVEGPVAQRERGVLHLRGAVGDLAAVPAGLGLGLAADRARLALGVAAAVATRGHTTESEQHERDAHAAVYGARPGDACQLGRDASRASAVATARPQAMLGEWVSLA